MITVNGKTHIKRYLAGWVPTIASSIAFGIGGKAEDANDISLQFEIDRADITLMSYDFVANKLIFKATMSPDLYGKIYEVGLYSQNVDTRSGSYASRVISTFDSDTEAWIEPVSGSDSTYGTSVARVGIDALVLSPAASGNQTAQLNDIALDLSGYSNADKFSLAYNVGSNVSSVVVRFKVDTSNYYQYTIASPAAGYRIDSLLKGSAVVTGAPSWTTINSIEIVANATAGGTGTVTLDGLRIEDMDTLNPEYVMVSRELLATPFTKVSGMVQEIEFSLDVAV